jgi:alanine dehydrogenase
VETLLLRSSDCERLLDWPGLLAGLGEAHLELSAGRAVQPVPRPLADRDDLRSDRDEFVPMTAMLPSRGLAVVKMLRDAPLNRAPLHRSTSSAAQVSTVSLYERSTGRCVAVIDGRALTRLRTAAATALATRALAPAGVSRFGFIGAGALAIEHLRVLTSLYDSMSEVRVWSPTEASARRFADTAVGLGVRAIVAASPADAARGSEVLTTLTPSRIPLLTAADVEGVSQLNAVGSPPRPVFTEIAPDVFGVADEIVVDHAPVALAHSGNIVAARAAGMLREEQLIELGTALGREPRAPREPRGNGLTVFNSVGLAIQDLAAAAFFCDRASTAGRGNRFDFVD